MNLKTSDDTYRVLTRPLYEEAVQLWRGMPFLQRMESHQFPDVVQSFGWSWNELYKYGSKNYPV